MPNRTTPLPLTARQAMTYLKDAVPELAKHFAKFKECHDTGVAPADWDYVRLRDRCLDKADAIDQWLAVFRLACCNGNLDV